MTRQDRRDAFARSVALKIREKNPTSYAKQVFDYADALLIESGLRAEADRKEQDRRKQAHLDRCAPDLLGDSDE